MPITSLSLSERHVRLFSFGFAMRHRDSLVGCPDLGEGFWLNSKFPNLDGVHDLICAIDLIFTQFHLDLARAKRIP